MRPLFFKILGLVLVAFIVVVVIAFFAFRWIGSEFEPNRHRLLNDSLEIAERAVMAYQEDQFLPFRRKLNQNRNLKVWILDENNVSLFQPPVPQRILAGITDYPTIRIPRYRGSRELFVLAHSINTKSGRYNVIMASRKVPFRRFQRTAVPLLASLLGLLAASGCLAYWILRPLRSFSQTARSISGENLLSRVEQKITRRKDAFGELGRELNRMTDRVSDTLDNQKQLLRDVSHELRSPLARIQVAASLSARKTGDSAELVRIEQEVVRLNDLIEDLLSLSRLRDLDEIALDKVEITSLLRNVVDDANYEYQSDSRSVVLNESKQLFIRGNAGLLSSALENIIRNALRFSPDQSQVRVDICSNASAVEIRVTDQGPGIEDKYLLRIFEPFFRADNARTIADGHHGIGLSITETIVKLHGGSIRAANLAGDLSGLEISISLPQKP